MSDYSQQSVDGVTEESHLCVCGDMHDGKKEGWRHRDERIITLPRGAQYADRGLNPATPLYITVEDRLRVVVVASLSAEVDITARLQLPDGQVIPLRLQLFPTANRTVNTFDIDLTEGFLLDLSATTPTAAVRVGALFVVAQIIRGAGVNALPSRTLLSNYVNSSNLIGWPEGPNQQSVQGAGVVKSVQISNPAAGADFTTTVPAGARWLVQSLQAQLVTSAAVANRIAHLVVQDGAGNNLFNSPVSAAQAASLTDQYSWCGGVQAAFSDGAYVSPIPDVTQYLQGFVIKSLTTALQAADQWSNIWLNVIEWLEV